MVVPSKAELRQRITDAERALGGALHGSAIYWNGTVNGPEVYMWAQSDNLKAFQFNGNTLVTPNFQTGPDFIGGEPGACVSFVSVVGREPNT